MYWRDVDNTEFDEKVANMWVGIPSWKILIGSGRKYSFKQNGLEMFIVIVYCQVSVLRQL